LLPSSALTVGFLSAGPVGGILADRYGARPFATGGLLLAALSFILRQALPVDFSYWSFAGLIFLNSAGLEMIIAHEPPAVQTAGSGRRHVRYLHSLPRRRFFQSEYSSRS
jgi:MFS family permease